jgi:hypothetical protein
MHAAASDAYRHATPQTCWLTPAYTPPLPYLWPGTIVGVFGTMASGDDPARNAERLTAAVQKCFCESDAVWTDTTAAEAAAGQAETYSVGYRDLDLQRVFFAPGDGESFMLDAQPIYSYSHAAMERICGIAKRAAITIP